MCDTYIKSNGEERTVLPVKNLSFERSSIGLRIYFSYLRGVLWKYFINGSGIAEMNISS